MWKSPGRIELCADQWLEEFERSNKDFENVTVKCMTRFKGKIIFV